MSIFGRLSFDGGGGDVLDPVRRTERYASGDRCTKKDRDGEDRYGSGRPCDRLR